MDTMNQFVYIEKKISPLKKKYKDLIEDKESNKIINPKISPLSISREDPGYTLSPLETINKLLAN